MAQTSPHIAQLILTQLTGSLTPEEQAILHEWRAAAPDNERWYQQFQSKKFMETGLVKFQEAEAFATTLQPPAITSASGASVPFLRRWWVAASIILVLGIGAFLWTADKKDHDTGFSAVPAQEILPGIEGAILTLSDGRQVVLDSLNNGVIASQNGSDVVLNNGTLAYTQTGTTTEALVYNTITTPNGRQFSVTLPDGTRVWLNAGSSIRYPTLFQEKQRSVEVTGEVYLEVAADKSKPFFVSAQAMEVQVLGTSFNINAYSDEPAINTTLLKGSIKVFKKTQPQSGIILQPGQQAIFGDSITTNKTVAVEQVIAWKNGVFNLNGATLEEFMRQIARWYDLTVVYQGAIPHKVFKGKIGRDLQLAQILQVLTLYNIKYHLSGKTITIQPS